MEGNGCVYICICIYICVCVRVCIYICIYMYICMDGGGGMKTGGDRPSRPRPILRLGSGRVPHCSKEAPEETGERNGAPPPPPEPCGRRPEEEDGDDNI